mmetsp:Transcript_27048/g.29930  ORF Transcript_27048/g.29930 Transcript_27048/m.29930 type:complete len:123 (+) Transcript_27048:107-475(+)
MSSATIFVTYSHKCRYRQEMVDAILVLVAFRVAKFTRRKVRTLSNTIDVECCIASDQTLVTFIIPRLAMSMAEREITIRAPPDLTTTRNMKLRFDLAFWSNKVTVMPSFPSMQVIRHAFVTK